MIGEGCGPSCWDRLLREQVPVGNRVMARIIGQIPTWDIPISLISQGLAEEGVAEATRKSQLRAVWEDCTGICCFGGGRGIPNVLEFGPRALCALTGWEDFTLKEALQIAERVINLERLFNMKRGLTIENDLEVSPRLLEAPDAGPNKGKTIAPYLRDLVKEFYGLMGWDRETGKPLDETIKGLGL